MLESCIVLALRHCAQGIAANLIQKLIQDLSHSRFHEQHPTTSGNQGIDVSKNTQ